MQKFALLSLIGTAFTTLASADCFSTKLGYKCCSSHISVVLTDSDGHWGVENGEWCGITENTSSTNCWSTALGYPCCSNANTASIYTDSDGEWGVENNGWCGIPELPSSSDMVEIAKAYMDKINIVELCPEAYLTRQEGVSYGKATKEYYFSNTTKTTRPVNVILPPNYTPEKKYPVLYFLHGILADEDALIAEGFGTIEIQANLAQEGKSKEMIMVLPNTYAPAEGTAVEPNFTQEYFDGYDNFINDLINDLMPYIESKYSVALGRENTALAGFSMGGRNSLYIGYTRPELFGYVGAFSPAPGVTPSVDPQAVHVGLISEEEFRIQDPQNTPYVTLISAGGNDNFVNPFPENYHHTLTTNEQPHVWMVVPGAEHNFVAVNAGFYNFVSSIFGVLNE